MKNFTLVENMDLTPRRCICCNQDHYDAPGPFLDCGDIGGPHYPKRVYFCQNGLAEMAKVAGWPEPGYHRMTVGKYKKAVETGKAVAEQLEATQAREAALRTLLGAQISEEDAS